MRDGLKVALIVFSLQLFVLLATTVIFNRFDGSLVHEIGGQDSREFMLLGDSLLTDGHFHLPDRTVPETWRTPGYPFFVAVVFALTGHSLAALLVILALVGALTSTLIYLIGRELSLAHRWSAIAAVMFGISPAVIWIPPSGMGSDIVFIFLFMWAIYLVLRLETTVRPLLYSLLIGLLLGSATLVRPLGLDFAIIVIVSIFFFISKESWRKRFVPILVALVGFGIVVTPWMARNEMVGHHFSLSSQFAFNPFYYNIPGYLAWHNHTSVDSEQVKLMDSVTGTRDIYAMLNGFAYTDRLSHFDVTFLKGHFFSYGIFHAFKLIPFFVGSGVNVTYATIAVEAKTLPDIPFFPRAEQNTASLFYGGNFGAVAHNLFYYWPSSFERVIWLLLFILSFVSPFVLSGKTRRFAILSVILIFVIAVLASPIAQPRYRIPAEPFVWLTAALALSNLRGFLARKRENVIA